jgi:O-antigen/teichoic acid export membrane protein
VNPGHLAREHWETIRAVAKRQLSVGVGIIAARIFGFASGAIIARSVGPGGFGLYSLAFTIFTSLLQLTSFADTWLVSRWGHAEQRPAVLAAVWRVKAEAALVMIAGSMLVAVGALATHAYYVAALLPALLAVLTAGAGGLTAALGAIGQAEQRFRLYTVAVAGPPLLTVLGSALLAAAKVQSPTAFMVALLASYFPLATYAVVILLRSSARNRAALRSDILSFGGWVTVGTVFYAVFQRIDLFLLGAFRSVTEVGQYGAAVRLSGMGALGASIVGAALMPLGSRTATWREPAARREYVRESGIAVLGIISCIGLAIALTPWLVSRVFGEAYAAAVPAARVLLAGQLVLGVQLPFYFALYALNGRRWIAFTSFAQLVTALVTGTLLARRFGATGAACSNALTYLVGAIAVALYLLLKFRNRERTA